ncbi:hypothetical protein KIW84_022717 [Lathyrus oleraceus]|uniref:Arabidopsis retrotransposon Orf1 C-terminal domain-containing protein n=1 Tax=Pisum sativum TaxID=3888 RepID=A0A9D4YF12_PEA|nr:hypothetical protein KIW84_022717 [Pisum sativum]
MSPRAVRLRREINYMGIAFAEGIDGENQRSRYHKRFKRDALEMRYPNDAALRALGLFDRVHWMLNNLGGSRTTGTTHFRMFNRSYAISQAQMADLLSFPHGYEFACQHPLESECESNALDFWQQLTGKVTTDWEGLKSTAIQNPIILYLHHILASTILAYFQSTSVRTGGPICVGGRITSIALTLNLGTDLATLEPLETPFVDLDYCRSMRIIKNKPDGRYFLLISNREVRGVTLPCVACIDMRISANWTFDLTDLEPDHMEQDAPQTGTHAYIAHAFPDSFEDRDVLLRNIQRQKEEMKVTIDQIRETQLDFVNKTDINMGDLIEQMNEMLMEVSGP